jgi:2-desacetyl-2-hydroxyethyl bacteriochlorophyllide A dehydrogenase
MLAVQKVRPAPGIDLVAIPDLAAPGPDEVLVEVRAAGICGSDVHISEWRGEGYAAMAAVLPITIGHEFAGRVTAVGRDVTTLKVGDRVTASPSIGCGACAACEAGRAAECAAHQGLGLSRPGCFAPFVLAPARVCLLLPQDLPDEFGALVEPLTIGANAVRIGEVAEGHRVLVLGAGPVAQGMAVFARLAGAREVVATGFDDSPRLEILRRLGVDHVFDLSSPDAGEALAGLAGEGFDVVLEATGAPETIAQGLGLLRRRGVFVAAGIHGAPAAFDVTQLVRRSLQIRGAYGAPMAVWRAVIDALSREPRRFEPIITHRLPFSDALEGFALAQSRAASKVILILKDD